MKKIIYALALLVSLTIVSCGSDVEKVKTFSIDVANAVNDFTLRDFEAEVKVAVTDAQTG